MCIHGIGGQYLGRTAGCSPLDAPEHTRRVLEPAGSREGASWPPGCGHCCSRKRRGGNTAAWKIANGIGVRGMRAPGPDAWGEVEKIGGAGGITVLEGTQLAAEPAPAGWTYRQSTDAERLRALCSDAWYKSLMRPVLSHDSEMATARAAACVFLRRLPEAYRVEQAILFGSRARGEHRPDSDLDLAIVLAGERSNFLDVKLAMAELAFDVLMETGILVQPFPLWDGDLMSPEQFVNPALIRNIAADGVRVA